MKTALNWFVSSGPRLLLFAAFLGISLARADDAKNPKLSAARARYDTKVTEASSALDDFNRQYFTQLEKLATTAQEEGNLDLVLAARTEQEAFRDRRGDLPEPSKLLALSKLQKIYAAQYPRLLAERNVKLAPVRAAHRDRLNVLIKELTKDGSLELAMEAKDELKAIDDLVKPPAQRAKKGEVTGRYVRVELKNSGVLSLAEVEIFSGGKNVAPQGVATQPSTYGGCGAERANDGNTSGKSEDRSTTHTDVEKQPWWEIDLLQDKNLTKAVVWNREGHQERLEGFRLLVLDADRKVVWESKYTKAPIGSEEFKFVPLK